MWPSIYVAEIMSSAAAGWIACQSASGHAVGLHSATVVGFLVFLWKKTMRSLFGPAGLFKRLDKETTAKETPVRPNVSD
jgi:hypothetical protein